MITNIICIKYLCSLTSLDPLISLYNIFLDLVHGTFLDMDLVYNTLVDLDLMHSLFHQEHKLRGKALENLGSRLMPGCASWILEAEPRERSWINPNAPGKVGVRILLAHKYARLVMAHGSLYENRVVWIKLEGIEGGSVGLACIYAPNIPTDKRHLWHIMVDGLPKDCEWIFGGGISI